jgi:hypothetical protein
MFGTVLECCTIWKLVYIKLGPNVNIHFGKGSQYTKGSIPDRDNKFFSSPQRPDQPCDPPTFLFSGYRGLYLLGLSSWDVKLTTHLHLMPSLRMALPTPPFTSSWRVELILPYIITQHVLNHVNPGVFLRTQQPGDSHCFPVCFYFFSGYLSIGSNFTQGWTYL